MNIPPPLKTARIARLATVDGAARPHIVPIVFALRDDRLVTAVDDKPKSTTELKRVKNIRANPAVSVLVDHYDEEWDALWWVRVDGEARLVESGADFDAAIAALAAKYQQYRNRPPVGPVINIEIGAIRSWSAQESAGSRSVPPNR